MEADDFDVYPIAHNGRVYNILTAMDMTFREVRGMIDWLDARGAFSGGGEGAEAEAGELFSCPVEGFVFEVDVQGYEVIVYRRERTK
ncbi:MAG: hypothetical protein OHK0028_17720 [Deltaproteobacteria bacterium]